MIERDRDPVLGEGLHPRARMRVVAVNQGAVHIEKHGRVRCH